ncbi:chaperonin 10-like protein [Podospora australis]|uniref:Chaperonin 10-like protein n=1 Tax=Podospora australis TaxID=1536484 RepID=A0AAN6X1A7_9PEZI|nr:chaperonin 10-like protein [Podospora australis]
MAATLPAGIPASHPAVATPGPHQPLVIIDQPTELPKPDEALVHVEWTSSTPLDLHRADGGFAIQNFPFVMGCSLAGTVVALGADEGADDTHLRVGDKVFGFVADYLPREAGVQTYSTVPTYRISKLPANLTLQEAVAVPTNLVTAFHTITTDLGLDLPWPIPENWKPAEAETTILVWGAASSVGLYTVQVLRHWGYKNVLAVASGKHHADLEKLGAAACFDYTKADVVERILAHTPSSSAGPKVPLIIDCIGSTEGTLWPLSKIAEKGSVVAVMLPIIHVHAEEDRVPEYEEDAAKVLVGEWKEGVVLKNVRTFLYAENKFYRDHLQPEVIPTLLEQGVIQPNKLRVIQGDTMLERAQTALNLLRNRAPSGEKFVWRVAEEEK